MAEPPPFETLLRILALEHRQGYENRAVIGGLEAFLGHWEARAQASLPIEAVQHVADGLRGYRELSPDARRRRVADLVQMVRAAGGTSGGGADGHGSVPGRSPASPSAKRSASTTQAIKRPPAAAVPATRPTKRSASSVPPTKRTVRPAPPDPRTAGTVDAPVTVIPGIGDKRVDLLHKLGVRTVRDLLYHAPARYKDYSDIKKISALQPGDEATIIGEVWDVRRRQARGRVRDVLTVVLSDGSGTIGCTFFNQPYLDRAFAQGQQYVISGRVEVRQGRLGFMTPDWEPFETELVHTARLVPIYPLTAGLSQRWLRSKLKAALDQWAAKVPDPLPVEWRTQAGLLTIPQALRALHFPDSPADAAAGLARLAFDELLALQLWARRRRYLARQKPGIDLTAGRPALDAFIADLPFSLTGAQQRSIDEVAADLSTPVPMNRLLQGDVGSGKTAVAAAAVAMCVGAGAQAVIMAPTEILADQHFAGLQRLLAPLGYTAFDPAEARRAEKRRPQLQLLETDARPHTPVLARLTGSMRPAEKAATAAAVARGEVDLVVGTHAVIQESVQFAGLGLVVIDEQHRFGVMQRAELPSRTGPGNISNGHAITGDALAGDAPTGDASAGDALPSVASPGGSTADMALSDSTPSVPSVRALPDDARATRVPHVLIMTATPIPRTLAMVTNADLDQSVIDELPPGRKPVRTLWLGPDERDKAFAYIRHRVARGEQAYVVYPLVEESEVIEARAAVAEYERLSAEVFPDLKLGLLHGRLRPAEKEAVMRAFNAGDVQVLVATSVIEVGVDVPNATVMLIDGADRFGLAQLHQFRGRVGRGAAESACLLLSDDPSPVASERLKAMTRTADGLVLAELDLKLRGPGDYFGIQQSGVVDQFRFARHATPTLLTLAQRIAGSVVAQDPLLDDPALAGLRARVDGFSIASERA